jgi:hypothetical protein
VDFLAKFKDKSGVFLMGAPSFTERNQGSLRNVCFQDGSREENNVLEIFCYARK